jgi:hypothetical protein
MRARIKAMKNKIALDAIIKRQEEEVVQVW